MNQGDIGAGICWRHHHFHQCRARAALGMKDGMKPGRDERRLHSLSRRVPDQQQQRAVIALDHVDIVSRTGKARVVSHRPIESRRGHLAGNRARLNGASQGHLAFEAVRFSASARAAHAASA